ncbi:unnamed protein product [Mytilus edulis]|uniref:Fibronectin type-III domain-containing protein n=1 Tax=Mytilus edulis TaxID=6550 RepID=A0A8S3TD76_MYTED|nr:unnamed protein product [Mytilus edulis]
MTLTQLNGMFVLQVTDRIHTTFNTSETCCSQESVNARYQPHVLLCLYQVLNGHHGHHNYYFTIKATNLAGLSVMKTSVTYTHDVQLPAKGIVIDVPMMINQSAHANKDIEDIDFSTDKTSLAVSWTGFAHPHERVNFSGCVGTLPKMCDVSTMTVFTESPSFSFKV